MSDHTDLLLSLPEALGRRLLQQWVILPEVKILDSAYCSQKCRPAFHKLAYGNSVTYEFEPNLSANDGHAREQLHLYNMWLMRRNVSVSTFRLPSSIAEAEKDMYAKYLEIFSSVALVVHYEYVKPVDSIFQFIAAHCTSVRNFEISNCFVDDLEVVHTLFSSCHLIERLSIGSIRDYHYDSPFHVLAECCPGLQHLTLSFADISDESLAILLQRCPDLQSLKLEVCDSLTDAGIAAVGEHCKKLTEFSVSEVSMGDRALAAVLSNCPLLTVLNLDGVDITNTVSLEAAAYCPQLQELTLSWYSESADEALEVLAQHCKKLSHLNLSNRHIGDVGLGAIVSSNSLLTVLCVSHQAELVTGASVFAIAEHCPLLAELHMCCKGETVDAAVVALAKRCSRMSVFNVVSADIGETGLVALATHCTHLTMLIVERSQLTDASVVALALHCRLLTQLSARDCDGVADASMILLAQKCHNLQKVHLGGCEGLTDATWSAFAAHCYFLRSVIIGGAESLTDAGLAALYHGCMKLERVMVSGSDLVGITQLSKDLLGEKLFIYK